MSQCAGVADPVDIARVEDGEDEDGKDEDGEDMKPPNKTVMGRFAIVNPGDE
jgi:hypothetical protein